MTTRLRGKVALITAAGQGIGRAVAESFVAEGATVIASDVDESKLRGIDGAASRKLDVRSTSAVETVAQEIAAEFGALDVLVNCAGYVHHGSVLACSEQDWDFSFDLNVKSMHRTTRAFLPGMLRKQAGAIVNISSAVSSIRAVPDRYVYGATKAAVIGLTKAVAADFIRQGIRANAICPGTIESPSLAGRIEERSRATGQSPAQVEQTFVERQPMGRLGKPAEVAALAVFLASDEASYITGQAYLVDGGMAL
jgi:2-keto-3-deoxy-L-fuconate dehydrogenase